MSISVKKVDIDSTGSYHSPFALSVVQIRKPSLWGVSGRNDMLADLLAYGIGLQRWACSQQSVLYTITSPLRPNLQPCLPSLLGLRTPEYTADSDR